MAMPAGPGVVSFMIRVIASGGVVVTVITLIILHAVIGMIRLGAMIAVIVLSRRGIVLGMLPGGTMIVVLIIMFMIERVTAYECKDSGDQQGRDNRMLPVHCSAPPVR